MRNTNTIRRTLSRRTKGSQTLLIMFFQTHTSPANEHLCFVFEDNDAVTKMIIKGGSPSMRHISRTHRMNLDWSVDGINLDAGVQIRYVNTSKQIVGILTKGSFSRERWLQLTHLFNLTTPHMHSCSQSLVLSSVQKDDKMSKRHASCRNYQALSPDRTKPGELPSKMLTELTHKTVLSSTERLASPKHVQKTQPLEDDKSMLSATEKSVALKHEKPEDPTPIHKPHDEANEVLKATVLQIISRKFDTSSLRLFPVNQALLVIRVCGQRCTSAVSKTMSNASFGTFRTSGLHRWSLDEEFLI